MSTGFKISTRQRYVQFGGTGGGNGGGGDQNWTRVGSDIYNNNPGNVGIRVVNPLYNVDISGETRITTKNIRIGKDAGDINQFEYGIAIGSSAGRSNQLDNTVAIGNFAGEASQNGGCIAIGGYAGRINQKNFAVAIGYNAGQGDQGTYSIAIGPDAGTQNLGTYSIAIGNQASASNVEKAIVLNASGTTVAANTSSFFVKPIDTSSGSNNFLVYNPSSGKISYNSSSTKTFVIEHPLENDKYLVHGCLEGPEAGVYYRGKGKIENNEYTDVEIPLYTKNFKDFTVQVTPIGKRNCLYVSEVENSKFRVYGENGSFYWVVHALRHEIEVEPLKDSVDVKGSGPYLYL